MPRKCSAAKTRHDIAFYRLRKEILCSAPFFLQPTFDMHATPGGLRQQNMDAFGGDRFCLLPAAAAPTPPVVLCAPASEGPRACALECPQSPGSTLWSGALKTIITCSGPAPHVHARPSTRAPTSTDGYRRPPSPGACASHRRSRGESHAPSLVMNIKSTRRTHTGAHSSCAKLYRRFWEASPPPPQDSQLLVRIVFQRGMCGRNTKGSRAPQQLCSEATRKFHLLCGRTNCKSYYSLFKVLKYYNIIDISDAFSQKHMGTAAK